MFEVGDTTERNVYAAFIITYKRWEKLQSTIQALQAQTYPPSLILIVDNDPEQSAAAVFELDSFSLRYYNTGQNLGPAGGAYKALQLLFSEGWEWVLWVDDDDPPVVADLVQQLFRITETDPEPESLVMVGSVGVIFDRKHAKIKRIPDERLYGHIDVDMIGGGHYPLIHRRCYENNILPDGSLFFGNEELDFGLRLKNKGFRILISGELLKLNRVLKNKIGYKVPLYKKKNMNALWREYYSSRNMIHILTVHTPSFIGLCRFTTRILLKSLLGFRYGFYYGVKNANYNLLGLIHGYRHKMGIQVQPQQKSV